MCIRDRSTTRPPWPQPVEAQPFRHTLGHVRASPPFHAPPVADSGAPVLSWRDEQWDRSELEAPRSLSRARHSFDQDDGNDKDNASSLWMDLDDTGGLLGGGELDIPSALTHHRAPSVAESPINPAWLASGSPVNKNLLQRGWSPHAAPSRQQPPSALGGASPAQPGSEAAFSPSMFLRVPSSPCQLPRFTASRSELPEASEGQPQPSPLPVRSLLPVS